MQMIYVSDKPNSYLFPHSLAGVMLCVGGTDKFKDLHVRIDNDHNKTKHFNEANCSIF